MESLNWFSSRRDLACSKSFLFFYPLPRRLRVATVTPRPARNAVLALLACNLTIAPLVRKIILILKLYLWIFLIVSNRIVFFFPGKCNDNAGRYGEMCPKTGAPAKPTCCSVDGKAATLQSCKCGTTTCQANQMCTAATNKCVYPVCAKTDGSAASTSEKGCQCGDNACSSKSNSSWW